jgi:hypothetical protein
VNVHGFRFSGGGASAEFRDGIRRENADELGGWLGRRRAFSSTGTAAVG